MNGPQQPAEGPQPGGHWFTRDQREAILQRAYPPGKRHRLRYALHVLARSGLHVTPGKASARLASVHVFTRHRHRSGH